MKSVAVRGAICWHPFSGNIFLSAITNSLTREEKECPYARIKCTLFRWVTRGVEKAVYIA